MVGQCNNRIESGNTMVEECSWTGTNTGEITAPDGSKITPTGKTVNLKNCFIYEFENGKIKSNDKLPRYDGYDGTVGSSWLVNRNLIVSPFPIWLDR